MTWTRSRRLAWQGMVAAVAALILTPWAGPAWAVVAPDAPAPATMQELQEENARLRAQVEDLQKEVQRLRVLAGEVAPQDRTQAAQMKVSVETDQTTGQVTSAKVAPTVLTITAGSHADHDIHLAYADGKATLTIIGWYSGGVYGIAKDVTLHVDGQDIVLPITAYKDRRQVFGTKVAIRGDDEYVTCDLPPAALAQVAAAKAVTGQLGRTEFRLTLDQIALFRALDARLKAAPAVNEPRP